MNQKVRRLGILIFFLAACGWLVFLRLPTLSEGFCNPDLGETAYAARLLLDGRCPYSEAIISKPPGSVLIYALLFKIFGLHMTPVYLFASVLYFVAILLLYWIGKQAVGRAAGLFAAAAYAFYQSELMSSGLCPNYETWTIFPALGCLVLLLSPNTRLLKFLSAGFLAALCVWMKQTAVFFVAAAAIFLLLDRGALIKERIRRLTFFGLGLLASAPLIGLALAPAGCFMATLRQLNPFATGTYITAYDSAARHAFALFQGSRFWHSNGFLIAVSLLGCLLILSWRSGYPERSVRLAIPLFLAAALGSIASGGHFFGHYFVVLFPFLCLSAGLALGAVWYKSATPLRILIVALFSLGLLYDNLAELKFARLSLAGLQNHGAAWSAEIFAANERNQLEPGTGNELVNHLEWQPTYLQLAAVLRAQLQPGQTIWCFDYLPELYFFTGAYAPTRHQEHFDIVTSAGDPQYGLWHSQADARVLAARRELMVELEKVPPRFVLRLAQDCFGRKLNKSSPDWPRNIYGRPMNYCQPRMEAFPELENWLAANYIRIQPPDENAVEVFELRVPKS